MFQTEICGITLVFETSPALFSPRGLDAGTRAMLARAGLAPGDKVLDLGCGYGPVGIAAAKLIGEGAVTMTDIDPDAVAMARRNAALNGVPGVRLLQGDGLAPVDDGGYTCILSNPPYHADFSVPKHFIEQGFRKLALGGRLILVTRRREWYKRKLIAIFGGVTVCEADGYQVFTAEKRGHAFAKR